MHGGCTGGNLAAAVAQDTPTREDRRQATTEQSQSSGDDGRLQLLLCESRAARAQASGVGVLFLEHAATATTATSGVTGACLGEESSEAAGRMVACRPVGETGRIGPGPPKTN